MIYKIIGSRIKGNSDYYNNYKSTREGNNHDQEHKRR